MKRAWFFGLSLTLITCAGLPRAVFGQETAAKGDCQNNSAKATCQDESGQETYEGEPVYRNGHGVTPPRPTYRVDPEYDNAARKKKIQGVVVLSIIVTKEGRAADVKVVKSLTSGLDKQAIKAVSQWRFEPATKDGVPVAVRLAVETDFHLY